MLHRAEIVDLDLLWNDDDAARMLARGAAHPGAARRQPVFLGARTADAALLHILLDIAVCGLFGHRTNGARAEYMVMAKQLAGIPVDLGLVFTRKIQVDIRHLVALKPKEGFKRDAESLFGERPAAFWAGFIG